MSCGPVPLSAPSERELRVPTGIAIDPEHRWLFVTQGNLDLQDDYSLLAAYDLAAIRALAAQPAPGPGCRARQDPLRGPVCDLSQFLVDKAWVLLPSGAANIAVDPRHNQPWGRLLVPTRHRSALAWIDLQGLESGSLRLECGQQNSRVCAGEHILDAVEFEPARIYLDQQGFDFAYLPHLLDNRLSLLALSGPSGPQLVDQNDGFFEAATVPTGERGGGFGLAQLPCDKASEFVPRASRDCQRPLLYAGQRFVHGLRSFSVAVGRKVLLSGSKIELSGHEPLPDAPSEGWPSMGGLWVSAPPDPELFVVQHEPPMLLRVELALDPEHNPVDRLIDAVPLCDRADLMQAVPGPGERTRLWVSCPARGELWVLDPASMRRVGSVKVGAGANELWLEADHKRLWVVNSAEHSLSVVNVDPQSPGYLREELSLMAPLPK